MLSSMLSRRRSIRTSVPHTRQGHPGPASIPERHPFWNRHHGQGGEDAIDGIHFQGHGREQPLPCRAATHRPAEVGRVGPGNVPSMNQDVCPFGSRGRLAVSSSTPSRINSQRTSSGLDSRLWSATPVVMPPSWRRTGTRASLTGVLAPTPATPRPGWSKRTSPPMGPSETTFTDPLTRVPRARGSKS